MVLGWHLAEEFDRVVSIDLLGVFLGVEAVLAIMGEQGSGYIVNTASVGGIRGVGNQSVSRRSRRPAHRGTRRNRCRDAESAGRSHAR